MQILWISLVFVPIFCQYEPYGTAKKYKDMRRKPTPGVHDKDRTEMWDEPSAMHLHFLERLIKEEPSLSYIREYKVLEAVSQFKKDIFIYHYKLKSQSGDIIYLSLTLWDTENGRRHRFTKDDIKLSKQNPLVERLDFEKLADWGEPSAMQLQFLEWLIKEEPSMSKIRNYKVLSAASKFTSTKSLYYYKLESPKGKIRYLTLTLWDSKNDRSDKFTKDYAQLSRDDPLADLEDKGLFKAWEPVIVNDDDDCFLDSLMKDIPSMSWIKDSKLLKVAYHYAKEEAHAYFELLSPTAEKIYLKLTLWDRQRGFIRPFTAQDVQKLSKDPLLE